MKLGEIVDNSWNGQSWNDYSHGTLFSYKDSKMPLS